MAKNAHNAFCTTLQQIGFYTALHVANNKNGFQPTMLNLAAVQDDDLDRLCMHLKPWTRDAAPGANHQVRIPLVSLKKLKAMCYLVVAQCCIGNDNPHAQDFTDEVLLGRDPGAYEGQEGLQACYQEHGDCKTWEVGRFK